MIFTNFFQAYDTTTGVTKAITESSNPALYRTLLYKTSGIPYAYYSVAGWKNEGMSVRIPPYYPLEPNGTKKKSDGTPKYQWEMWSYNAMVLKEGKKKSASSTYILYDTRSNDVHYRVTHES